MSKSRGKWYYIELFAGGTAEPAPEGRLLHLALRTEDVDAALAAAVSAGAIVTIEPKDVVIADTAVRVAFCTGPDNEVIEFMHCTSGTIR